MKKNYVLSAIAILCACLAYTQSSVETKRNISEVMVQSQNIAKEQTLPPTLVNFYSGNVPNWTHDEYHGGYILTQDGGYALAVTNNYTGNPNYNGDGGYMLKLDGSGNVQWTYSVTPMGAYRIWIHSVFQAADGNYYLAGWVKNGSSTDEILMIKKINTSGTLVWTRYYKDPGGATDFTNPQIIQSPGGNLYACYNVANANAAWFEFSNTTGNPVAGIGSMTAAGNFGLLNRARYTSTGKIGLLSGGRTCYFNLGGSLNMYYDIGGWDFIEAGGSIYYISTTQKTISKLSYFGNSIGSYTWCKRYVYYPTDANETFLSFKLATDGNLICYGRSKHQFASLVQLAHFMKIDASNGNILWVNVSGAISAIYATQTDLSTILTKPNGDYAVFLHSTYSATTGYDPALLEITSSGSYNGCYDNNISPTVTVLTPTAPANTSPLTLTVTPTTTALASVSADNIGSVVKYIACNASSGSTPTAIFTMTNSGCINQAVNLTNSSTGNPAPTYVWSSNPSAGVSFAPSTSNATSVTFANPGTYTVTLAATNTVGTNSTSNVISITSCTTGGGGGGNNCDSLKNITNPLSIAIYVADSYAPADSGYIAGTNKYCDKGKYEKYTSGVAGQQLYGIRARVYKASGSGNVTFKVYNDAAGNPGSVIASKTIPLSSLSPLQYNYITLTTPINVTTPYYVGFDVPGGGCSTLDTMVVYTSNFTTGGGTANMAYEQWSDNSWHTYNSTYSATFNNYMFPIFCAPGTNLDEVMMNSERFVIYPNPGTGKYKIRNEYYNEFAVEVRDNLGKIVLQNDKLKNNEELDISHLSNGIYLVNIKTGGGEIVKKLFKN